jgi:plastocyanin
MKMCQPISRRALTVTAAAALLVAAMLPAAATAAPSHETITAKVRNGDLAFVPDNTAIRHDGRLTIRNRTDEPHTFSIVKPNNVPDTRRQQRRCFRRGHICRRIFRWHEGGEKRRVNAGAKGFNKAGDSVFFNDRARARITADEGRTLNFICGIHPQMQGRLHVR